MSLVGLAFLLAALLGVAALALWPYFDRWRSGGAPGQPAVEDTAEPSSEKSRRLTIILFVVAVVGLVQIGLRFVGDRELDEREHELRRELADAELSRLENVRVLLREPGREEAAAQDLDALTSRAQIGYRSVPPTGGEPTVAFAKVDWLWAARCYLLTIEPGGEHNLVRDEC